MIIKLDRTAFKRRLWQRAYQRQLAKKTGVSIQQLVFYGIKCYGRWYEKSTKKDSWTSYQEFQRILDLMTLITPREFLTMFPIKKEFDGQKYECKDYFYTQEYLSTINLDEPISEPFEFLWDYWNRETARFLMNMMGAMSDVRKEQTGKGIMQEFLEKEGFDF
ncbi:TPA: hypothetical protein ACU3U7_002710 [Enterococcus faecalis]